MSDITNRLDQLKRTIQEADFLQGKGLSNEVNIHMFCHGPKDEIVVRNFAERLEKEQLKCNVQTIYLYEIFLSICEDMNTFESIS